MTRNNKITLALGLVGAGLLAVAMKATHDFNQAVQDNLRDIDCAVLKIEENLVQNHPDIAAKHDIKMPTDAQRAECPEYWVP